MYGQIFRKRVENQVEIWENMEYNRKVGGKISDKRDIHLECYGKV